jgi:hypothetical protein
MMTTPAPGSCTLTASKAGYVTKTSAFSFPSNGAYIQNLAIDPLRNRITGNLKDSNGQPIQGGKVIAYQPGTSTVVASNQTDASGFYIVSVPSGTYDVQFNVSGVYVKLLSVDLSSDVSNILNYFRYDSSQLKFTSSRDNQEFRILTPSPSKISLNNSQIAMNNSLNDNTYYYSSGMVYLRTTSDLKSDCIYSCCSNEARYRDKSCSSGYYCSARSCNAKIACPYTCCVGEDQYIDKTCSSGYSCVSHSCVGSSIALVQGSAKGSANIVSGSFTVSLAQVPTNGDVLIMTYMGTTRGYYGNPVIAGISQAGVTWSLATSYYVDSPSYVDSEIWVGAVGANAAKDITISVSGGESGGHTVEIADVCEWSGLSSTVDKTANGAAASTTAGSTGTTAATTQPSELWVGAIGAFSFNGPVQSLPTNGFTLLDGQSVWSDIPNSLGYLYKIVSSTGTANSGVTFSSPSYWTGVIATFKGS